MRRKASCRHPWPSCSDCRAKPQRRSPPLPSKRPIFPPTTLCKVLLPLPKRRLSTVEAKYCMLIQCVTSIGAVIICVSNCPSGSRSGWYSCKNTRPSSFACFERWRGAMIKAALLVSPHSGRVCVQSWARRRNACSNCWADRALSLLGGAWWL
ncbi:Uncharacterised protein [Vibrio cholerae]|nr:Uncharacterised protein [Vibrio cholerae]